MKLIDLKGSEAVERIADLIEPIAEIASNPENEKALAGGKLKFAVALLKNNSKEVVDIVSAYIGEDANEMNAAQLINFVVKLLKEPGVMELFGLQGETEASSPSA